MIKSAVGRPGRRAVSCESLETRAYAAKISYGADYTLIKTVLGIDAGVEPGSKPYGAVQAAVHRLGPASVVRTLDETRAEPRQFVTPYLDKSGTLYLHGTFGDDTIVARNIGHGVIRINYVSIQNETSLKSELDAHSPEASAEYYPVPGSPELGQQPTLTANTFEVNADDVRRIFIDGRAGVDTVRSKGLSFVPVTIDVEHESIAQTAAPAGATPSDPLPADAYSPKSGRGQRALAERRVADASRADVAFFGDSHAQFFPDVGQSAWRAYFPRAVALGIRGDGTRQLLSRINGGVFDTFKPKTLVLSVGTNNLSDPASGGTDAQVTAGVLAVVDALHAKLPKTRIVVLGLAPRADAGLDQRARTINAALTTAATDRGFTFVDVYTRLAADRERLLTASSHYTAKGYSALASLLVAALKPA